MDIKWYVLGSYHLWGQFLGYPPLLLNQGSLPLLPAHFLLLLLLPSCSLSLPMANVGKGYVILCFGVPTTSVGARGERE